MWQTCFAFLDIPFLDICPLGPCFIVVWLCVWFLEIVCGVQLIRFSKHAPLFLAQDANNSTRVFSMPGVGLWHEHQQQYLESSFPIQSSTPIQSSFPMLPACSFFFQEWMVWLLVGESPPPISRPF